MTPILRQPNHRRVATDRLSRVDSQLVSLIEGESDPILAKDPSTRIPPKKVCFEGKENKEVYCCTTDMGDVIHSPPAELAPRSKRPCGTQG